MALENKGDKAETLDLIYVQDLALAEYGAVRLNEYYVSQYVDHAPLSHPERGLVLASRQNQSMGGRNPWCVIGSLGGASASPPMPCKSTVSRPEQAKHRRR